MFGVSPELFTWVLARATGLASYCALCLAILSGIALRTSVIDFLAKSRAIRAMHDFTTWIWLPLGGAHVLALVVDKTARVDPIDLLVPFQTDYGRLAIGLGTISFDIVLLIVVTSVLRERMNLGVWRFIHRLSYVAFVTLFLHAFLAGTDFDSPVISAISWSAAAGIALLAISRITLGRLPE